MALIHWPMPQPPAADFVLVLKPITSSNASTQHTLCRGRRRHVVWAGRGWEDTWGAHLTVARGQCQVAIAPELARMAVGVPAFII